MGIGPFKSTRGDDFDYAPSAPPTRTVYVAIPQEPRVVSGNPNPSNYEVLRSHQIGKNLVVELKYPDCTNYEGRKIMLYKNLTISKLLGQKLVDPHFAKGGKFRSPIARFEPTEDGWKLACAIATMIS